MEITLPVDGQELATRFPNLRARILQLHSRVICYDRFGSVYGDVPYDTWKDTPVFTAVTFDDARAYRYEETAERFYGRPYRGDAVTPKPRFAVTLTVDFGCGIIEPRTFDFRKYADEAALTAFCAEAAQHALDVFRHRRSPRM